jgi:hypothetical protein
MMGKFFRFQLILALFSVLPVFSQDYIADSLYSLTDTLEKEFDLFLNNDILELSLWFDITEYTRKKPKEEYLDAILTCHISDNDSINKKIKLKSCGEFRNKYCNFPPMVLNFKKTEFAEDDLLKLDKVKLFTHCRKGYEEYLFREYLVYRLYNILTVYSFRVQLVRISYHNTSKATKPIQTYGFFIEPMNILSERLNSVQIGSIPLTQRNILPEMMDRMAIFSYMIGNTDWSVSNQHNCKILGQQEVDRPDLYRIIPFDFDYAGIVNTCYAVPFEGLGIESVRERIYLGLRRSEEDFIIALQKFSNKKEEFYKLIREFDLINQKTKKDMVQYLDEFYNLFNDRNTILYEILKDCKDY